jgi:hypothetical protein
VQRVLGSYEAVATASEPWLLLPFLLPLRSDVPASGSWQPAIHEALDDFFAELPEGAASYRRTVGDAARRLYTEAAGEAPFYLDKTPPYNLIVDEIVETFPEAKIVVLWRNPLSVLASVVETFCAGRWRPQDYPTTLFDGLQRLVSAASLYDDRLCTVRYEDLLEGEEEWRRLCGHIGLEFDPGSLHRFSEVRLRGAMGDPTGTKEYSRLEREPTSKWRRTISNPVRRLWARRYLDWIGDERLAFMGYDGPSLRDELAKAEAAWAGVPRDALDLLDSVGRDLVKSRTTSSTGVWQKLLRPAEGAST